MEKETAMHAEFLHNRTGIFFAFSSFGSILSAFPFPFFSNKKQQVKPPFC